jgi:polyisoprenoid-binding protein YceI
MPRLRLATAALLAAAVALPAGAQSRAARTTRAATTPVAAPATWTIDVAHSEMTFRVRHLMGRTRGSFQLWNGTLVADPARLQDGAVEVSVKTASVNTENTDRDAHLRSPDFFAADSFPAITFKSTKVRVGADKKLRLDGILTMRGVSKPVTLVGTYNGAVTDPWGKQRLAFEATGRINRKDFGLAWSKVTEGVALVGDEVDIDIAIEAVKN